MYFKHELSVREKKNNVASVLAREENFRSGDEGGEGICSSAGGLELCEQRAQSERRLRSDR